MTPSVAASLQPECGIICSVEHLQSEPSTSQSRKQNAEKISTEHGSSQRSTARMRSHTSAEEILPDMKVMNGTGIRYTTITMQKYPSGATADVITKYCIDNSFQLESILRSSPAQDPLGEIQFSFICFLIGQNYASFEQWKCLVHLLCTSAEAMQSRSQLFIDFISALHFQIREIPSDFFVDIVSRSNFLTSTLHELFSNLDCDSVDGNLRSKGLKFQQHLTKKFKWDFTSEPDEYAPVIVECQD